MVYLTKEQMAAYEARAERRRNEIRNTPDTLKVSGTSYYVSENGDDTNAGTRPEKAWKSLAKVTDADLRPGDGVYFERGGVFRGHLMGKEGVTYAAYGHGEKPKLYASPCDAAKVGTWTQTDAKNVYVYDRELDLDIGTLVFNDGESCARKVMKVKTENEPWLTRCREMGYDPASTPTLNLETCEKFSDYHDLCHDLDFFHDYTDKKRVYLYSDKGNPAQRFWNIEINIKMHVVRMAKNDRLDNLCIKYGGAHGACGGTCGITITNCEFGWIGGSIQGESIFGRPHPTRYGNAVEIYGSCYDYTVDNCWFYQIYDAAITHQYSLNEDGTPAYMFNVAYTNNLIETSSYSIEYFLSRIPEGNPSYMKNILYKNNFCRNAGYGWGAQRPDKDTPAHIKGWEGVHRNHAKNFVIEDNVFENSAYMLVQCSATLPAYEPTLRHNVYIQKKGGQFGMVDSGFERHPYDDSVEALIRDTYEDKEAEIYYLPEE